MCLASVLARHDVECLLSELKTLQSETPAIVSGKAELQDLCGHLEQVHLKLCGAQLTFEAV